MSSASGSFCSGRWLLALALVAAVPVLPSLRDPFVADDYLHITRLDEVRSGSLVKALRSWTLRSEDFATWPTPPGLAVEYFRPLVSLSFLTDHAIWGLHPFGYRLTDLLLHVLTTLVVFGLACAVLGEGLGAFVAAVLFGLHPCHTEAVLWISARTDVLAALLYVGSLLAFVRRRPVVCLALCALALLAKETATTLPVALLGLAWIRRDVEPMGRQRGVLLAAFGLLGLYGLGRLALFGALHAPPPPLWHRPTDPGFAWQVASALGLYLADLVLFVPLDAALTQPFWSAHPVGLAGLCAVAAAALASTSAQARGSQARWVGLGLTAIAVLPVLPVAISERYLYLPSAFYCILAGAQIPQSPEDLTPKKRRGFWGLVVVVLLVTLGKSFLFGWLVWQSRAPIDEALQAIDQAPGARLLLAVDLPVTSALAFPHALRLERPARTLDVEILSISNTTLSAVGEENSDLQCSGPASLRVSRDPGGFLGSYAEHSFLGGRPPFVEGEIVERRGFTVQVGKVEGDLVRDFELRFRDPEPAGRLVLAGEGFHLHAVPLTCATAAGGVAAGGGGGARLHDGNP
jgi:hypothetical protein